MVVVGYSHGTEERTPKDCCFAPPPHASRGRFLRWMEVLFGGIFSDWITR